jgi:hypothetical protein
MALQGQEKTHSASSWRAGEKSSGEMKEVEVYELRQLMRVFGGCR